MLPFQPLLELSAPKDQLVGAAGIGWSPAFDIGTGDKPEAVSENETRCLDLMDAAGQKAAAPTALSFQLALGIGFFYLADAAEQAGGTPSHLLGASRAAVGSTFAPANTFTTDVTSRVDGVAVPRPRLRRGLRLLPVRRPARGRVAPKGRSVPAQQGTLVQRISVGL